MSKVVASVIIPNWNGEELLKDSLGSLKMQTSKDFEIILVDNGSSDGSVKFASDKYPEVKIIRHDRNCGFAKAINEGVKVSQGKYVLFLNNDTKVEKKWLEHLISCAEAHPEASSVGCKLLNFYNRKIIDGVGIEINEVGQAKSLGWQEKDNGQFEKEMYVFGVTGGASLFRKDIFLKVGMFDEDYFLYSEEVDLAFRMQFLGHKSIYCPKAIVYHKHKATAKRRPQYIEYWQFKNMMQTIIKDFPTSLLLKNWRWLKILLVNFNTILYQLASGFIWPPLLTQAWLIWNLPRLLRKRKEIQAKRKVSDEYIESFFQEKNITFWGLTK